MHFSSKHTHLNIIVLLFFSLSSKCYSSKILFYFGSSPNSHQVAVWPLAVKLAERGHKITYLGSPFNEKGEEIGLKMQSFLTPPNLINFHPKSLVVYWKENQETNETMEPISSRIKGLSDGAGYWDRAMKTALEVCRVIFRSLEVQTWAETSTFDLILIDTPYNECALGLAYKLRVPYILFGTTSFYMWHQEMFGLPDETSWLPNFYNHFPSEMNFFQRVRNTLTPLQWFYSTNRVSYIMPQMERLMMKALNVTELPPFDDLERDTSLFLLNTHFIQDFSRSLPPFVVPVGGMHLLPQDEREEKSVKLPRDLLSFLEKYGESGFIYMNFGTRVKPSKAPAMVVEKFINSFALLDIAVLWRWDDLEKAPKMSGKLFFAKWFPQSEILAHPNIRIFITNAGVLSHQEAIYYGVPVIAFPLTPEEDYNSAIIEKSGIGFRMDIAYFTQYELATNIRKLTTDETFKNNVMRLGELFKDRPQNPVDSAVWWTEYVLRHKNLSFTKPLAIHQSWYQRRLLDVWAFLGLLTVGSLIVIVTSVNYAFCQKSPQPKSKQKSKMS